MTIRSRTTKNTTLTYRSKSSTPRSRKSSSSSTFNPLAAAMTEAKKIALAPGYRAHKALRLELSDVEDDSFAAHLAEQLRRLPTDSQVNAMVEILAILNQFVRVQGQTQ